MAKHSVPPKRASRPSFMPHDVPPVLCFQCGAMIDAGTGAYTRAKPRPGDISMCLYCGYLTRFTDDLRLRRLTEAEVGEVEADPAVRRLLAKRRLLQSMFDARTEAEKRSAN